MVTLSVSLDCCRRIFVWRSGAGRQISGRSAGSEKATNHPDHTATPCLQGLVRNKPKALSKSERGPSQGDRPQCTDSPGKLHDIWGSYSGGSWHCGLLDCDSEYNEVEVTSFSNRRHPPTRLQGVTHQETTTWRPAPDEAESNEIKLHLQVLAGRKSILIRPLTLLSTLHRPHNKLHCPRNTKCVKASWVLQLHDFITKKYINMRLSIA